MFIRDRLFLGALRAPDGGDGGGDGGDGGGDGGDGGGAAPVTDWKAALPEDMRGSPTLKDIASVEALATKAIGLEKLIGSRGPSLPAEDAPQEEWDKFLTAAGRPESADKYDLGDFKPPEGMPWDKDVQSEMQKAMHEAGLSNKAANSIIRRYAEISAKTFGDNKTQVEAAIAQSEKTLRAEHGKDYDARLDLGNRLMAQVFGDQLNDATGLKLANGMPVFDHPLIVGSFMKLAQALPEDAWGKAGASPGAAESTQAGALAAITKLRAEQARDPKHPLNNPKDPEHKATQERLNALYSVAYPDQVA